MVESFNFISIYWLIPVPIIFALLGLGLFHRWLGAGIVGVIALLASLIFYDSYLNDYTTNWLNKQRVYMILFRDFPKDKDVFVSEYVRAFERGGKAEFIKKNEEMKVLIMANYARHYIASTPTPVIASYIVAQTWMLATIYRKNYNLCQSYMTNFMNFGEVWKEIGDEIFLTSVRYNPFIISEAVYNPEPVSESDAKRAMDIYRKLVRDLRDGGVHFSNDADKIVSCDTIYREFYMLSQMPPKDAALLIKLLYSQDHLEQAEPMSWLKNLMPF